MSHPERFKAGAETIAVASRADSRDNEPGQATSPWRYPSMLKQALLWTAAVSVLWTAGAHGQRRRPDPEPLVDQVRKAIDRGIQYLVEQENRQGNWELDPTAAGNRGGWTSLALLGLLNAGVKPGHKDY